MFMLSLEWYAAFLSLLRLAHNLDLNTFCTNIIEDQLVA